MKQGPDRSQWNLQTEEGTLHLDGVSLQGLAEQYGTPVYVVSARLLANAYDEFLSPFIREGVDATVFYSFKTNPVPGVLNRLIRKGAGAEVTSEHELRLAQDLGVHGDRIVVNGTYKSDTYLSNALAAQAVLINIESIDELERLREIAEKSEGVANIALRVNPGLKGRRFNMTLTTAKANSPMGLAHGGTDWHRALDTLRRSQKLNLRGIHVHLGSGISSSSPYKETLQIVLKIWKELLESGFNPDIVNLGGGFSIPTCKTLTMVEAAAALALQSAPKPPTNRIKGCQRAEIAGSWKHDFCEPLQQMGASVPRLVLEPGRALSASSQLLLLEVKRVVKRKNGLPTVICDGGAMGLSPSLWTEYHAIFVVDQRSDRPEVNQMIIGNMPAPIDIVTPCMRLPELTPGDVICVMDTGAYFTSFGNNFAGPRPPIVMIEDAGPRLIRRRETYGEMYGRDVGFSDERR